jgi:hypothetical protein
LYFDAAGLTQLKQLASEDADTGLGWNYAAVFQEIVKAADQVLASPYTYTVEIPNPNGQGSVTWTYSISSTMPPPHPNNPGYPPWTKVSRDLQSRMEVLSFVYAVTGDSKYLSNAQGTGALDIAKAVSAWSKWTDPGYLCGTGNSCLDTAHLLLGVGMTYDLGYGVMTDAERKTLREALIQKGVTPLAKDVNAANSASGGLAAWFNGYALRVTGLAVGACAVAEDVPAQSTPWTTLARQSVLAFFDSQGKDGGAFEGHLYGAYAVDNLVIAAHVLDQKSLGSGLFDHGWLADLPRFAGAFLGSDNRSLANFGDSSTAAYWATTMFALAAHGNASAQWYLVQTGNSRPRSFLNMVWSRPTLTPTPLAGSGTSLYQDVGYAVLRDGFQGAPVVAVKSGPPKEKVGHNHFDHNSFILSAHGHWIASDPGYEDYFNPSKHLYTTGSIGHNTILVDKTVSSDGASVSKGQVSLTGGKLDFLFDGVAYAKVVGQAAATYEAGLLDRFGRRIFYSKPDLVFIFDDLASSKAHEYSFLLHSGSAGKLTPGQGPGELVSSLQTAMMQTFFASSVPLVSGYPRVTVHPGASDYGPYGEWRSQSYKAVRFAAALVPGVQAHVTFDNPGFEDGLSSWQPRFADGTHSVDEAVAHSGKRSARIEHAVSKTGYYYSEVMSLVPGSTLRASVFVKSKAATGSISIQPFFTLGGVYITDPAGKSISLDAKDPVDWTEVVLQTQAPVTGVDGVRIALQFTGSGTVWFDDASYWVDTPPPQTEPSTAVVLGDPPAGLAVSGPWGIDAAASFMGSGLTGTVTVQPATQAIAQLSEISTDGSIFCVGFEPKGGLRRMYLQGGTFLSMGGKELLRASKSASFDMAIRRHSGCTVVELAEVETLEGPPYTVAVVADEVWLGAKRVPFVVQGETTTFPEGSDLGPGCAVVDAGTESGADDASAVDDASGVESGVSFDAATDVSSQPGEDASEGGLQARGSAQDEASGCACRAHRFSRSGGSFGGWAAVALLLALGLRSKSRVRIAG